jgi:hypothetical protein
VAAVNTWNSYETDSDRQWFEPLFKAVPGSERKQGPDGGITRPESCYLLKRYTG